MMNIWHGGKRVLPGQGFYANFLEKENYKQSRFHDLAKRKGLPAVLVSHALQNNKARYRL